MPADRQLAVRVRVNVSGARLIGYVQLPAELRISDWLNGPEPFLLVSDDDPSLSDQVKTRSRAVLKQSISYLGAVEEPTNSVKRPNGSFQQVSIDLRNPRRTVQGELFVPEGRTVAAVLNETRGFISLRHVIMPDSVEKYPYLAVRLEAASLIAL
jgi:hypothetical protein